MMCLMVFSYFTVSENINITRGVKIILRLGMIGGSWLMYRYLLYKGHPPSFKHEHKIAAFFYLLYLFWGLMSVTWSTKWSYSLLQFIMTSTSVIFVWFFWKILRILQQTYGEIRHFRYSAILSNGIHWIVLAFNIGAIVAPDIFYRLTHGGTIARLGGYLMNPNELGMMGVVGMGGAMLELRYSNKKKTLWWIILNGVISLLLTGSRSTLIGFFLVAFYFIYNSDLKVVKYLIYAAAVFVVPVAVQMIFLKGDDGLDEVLSMTGRLPFWTALLTEAFPKEPLFGYGFMRIYYTDAFQGLNTYPGKMTHNTFIQVLMNLGFVGFFTVVMQMMFTVRAYVKSVSVDEKTIFVATGIPIFINSLTEFGIFGETNFGILFYQLLIGMFLVKYNHKMNLKYKLMQRRLKRRLAKMSRDFDFVEGKLVSVVHEKGD